MFDITNGVKRMQKFHRQATTRFARKGKQNRDTYFSTYLVTTLTSLHMYNFPHLDCFGVALILLPQNSRPFWAFVWRFWNAHEVLYHSQITSASAQIHWLITKNKELHQPQHASFNSELDKYVRNWSCLTRNVLFLLFDLCILSNKVITKNPYLLRAGILLSVSKRLLLRWSRAFYHQNDTCILPGTTWNGRTIRWQWHCPNNYSQQHTCSSNKKRE